MANMSASESTSRKSSQSSEIALPDAPLCNNGCNIILISSSAKDEQLLPELASQIYGRENHRGKTEFMMCDRESDPESIQERLSDMQYCDTGITMVIVGHWFGTFPLTEAVNESNLRKFLEKKGLSGKDLQQELQNIKRSLALFTYRPSRRVIDGSAKIAANFRLSDEGADGKLRKTNLDNGEVFSQITFHRTPASPLYLRSYIFDSNIKETVRKCLRIGKKDNSCNHKNLK